MLAHRSSTRGGAVLDVAIRGGTVVDGTGEPARVADVGIRDGRIVAVGEVADRATDEVDAAGRLVCPGFVDPHTHYDAQLWWDPFATPSIWHGVTTVIGGNCGFSLAPLRARDADYTRRMMAQVEGMPLGSLEQAVPWTWEAFGEFLGGLDGAVAVNAGFHVGHCALRRHVMGADFAREATDEEVAAMAALLDRSLAEGAIGFSTGRGTMHLDADGVLVPSAWATPDEVLALCRVVAGREGVTLEAIVEGCMGRFDDEEVELLATMSATAGRPLNWNVLTVQAGDPSQVDDQLRPSRRAREVGGQVVAITLPIAPASAMSFGSFCALWLLPGWNDVLAGPRADAIRQLQDPATREALLAKAQTSNFAWLTEFGSYTIGDVVAPENQPLRGRRVADVAAERGLDPFACVVEIAVRDDLGTVLWLEPPGNGPADWALRRDLWDRQDVMLGGSDAGAHLDRFLASFYPTRFLADCLRGRRLVPIERAVQQLSDVPARVFGLRDRGRLVPGAHADVVVIDPDGLDAELPHAVHDLPGGNKRLLATARGVERVLVNGVAVIVDGEPTGAVPGRVLRSGRDTETVHPGVAT
jgi:N-acyl-D-aspartate/D-glutamate deacylase